MDPEEQPSLHTPFIGFFHLSFVMGRYDVIHNAAQFPTVSIPRLQEDGVGNMDTPQIRASSSRPRVSNPRRLERFLESLAAEEAASVAGSAHSEEEGGEGAVGSLW